MIPNGTCATLARGSGWCSAQPANVRDTRNPCSDDGESSHFCSFVVSHAPLFTCSSWEGLWMLSCGSWKSSADSEGGKKSEASAQITFCDTFNRPELESSHSGIGANLCFATRIRVSSKQRSGSWQENKASEPASTASNSSGTGSHIADSETVFMPIVIPVAKQPSFHYGTSACRSCRTARGNRRCVPQWSHTCNLASVVAVSAGGLRRAVHTVPNRCPPNLPCPTSKPMRRARRKAGAGKGIGAESIASSLREKGLITTSDKNHAGRPALL